jgi:hypothetical protein
VIGVEEFAQRLCRLGADRGPRGFPRKRRDREILMQSITLGMDGAKSYSEPQINALLQKWSREIAPAIAVDHVTLRRLLVDHGRLERAADGSRYRVGYPPGMAAFDLAVFDLDLRATVAAFRAAQTTQRAAARADAGSRRRRARRR